MTIESLRAFCRKLPEVTEDIKWGHDLCFCVAGKMFSVVSLERPGIIPAPYMARNLWVQEEELGEVLERREIEALVKTAYDLVVAKLPKSRQPGRAAASPPRARRARTTRVKRSGKK